MLQSCGCGQVLEAWVKERTLEEVLAAMAAARVPSGAVLSPLLSLIPWQCCADTYLLVLPGT